VGYPKYNIGNKGGSGGVCAAVVLYSISFYSTEYMHNDCRLFSDFKNK